ncbi:MAG: Crp/Fnr family transcriptional regulator [Moheibacter sp.]
MNLENRKSSEWKIFQPYFKQIEVPAKTVLLEEGEISKTLYYIEKGCLRTLVNNDGKEITTQFFFENDSVGSFESFRTGRPSLYSIESLEVCVLQTISQKDFQKAIKDSAELNKELEEHLFRRLFQAQQLFYSYLKNSPQERYQELIKKQPQILKRVPQHYIASYLGITSVSLSRIRNRK